jgi:uncharacterized protein YndB with AHSA1/START domain
MLPIMDWNQYRFTSAWTLPATPGRVYAELARPDRYPLWWPQVREVHKLDESSGTMTVRSVLPYDLRFTLTAVREDPCAGVLEARMAGDLTGFSRWTLTGDGAGGTLAVFTEDVSAQSPLLRRLAFVARPAFRANHTLMMRQGRSGLRAFLRSQPSPAPAHTL